MSHSRSPLLPPSAALTGDTGFSPGDSVGGYRLVRLIGAGSRAEIYLGFAQSSPDAAAPATAAVKVFREDVTDDDISTELDALSRAAHPHVVAVRDLATTPRGQQCLVLERLSGGGLARLLRERSTLTGGEAVTILAPLADALDTLHRSGVAHGDLRVPSVAFRETGAPVLVGFGHAVVFAPGESRAALSVNAAVARDRAAFGELAAAVLARVAAPAAAQLAESLVEGDPPSMPVTEGGSLADRIFELAEPEPVRMPRRSGAHLDVPDPGDPDRGGVASSRGSRWEIAPRTPPPDQQPARRARPARPARPARRSLSGRGALSAERARPRRESRAAHRVPIALASLRAQLRGIRPRFWVTAGGVAVSLVVAFAVVPQSSPSSQGAVVSTPTPVAHPSSSSAGAPPADSSAVDSGSVDGTPADSSPDDPGVSDDPVAAVAVLLDEREQCLHELSLVCLEGVLQPGSAAMAADAALVESIRAGGERPPGASIPVGALVLVERLGDSALVGLGNGPETTPASTLVMRGEAGWRIRAYLPP